MLSKSEIRFYKLALERKIVSAEQVNRVIQQRKKLEADGDATPLERLMVREGLLTEEQALDLQAAPVSTITQPPEATRHTLPVGQPAAAISSPTLAGPAPPAPACVGGEVKSFGKYEVLGEIARGGMGIVYKVRLAGFDRALALKVILSGPSADEEERIRFTREAEVISRLRHPNIIAVHDVGSVGAQYYYTMDFIEGKTLDVLAKEGLPTRRALELVRDVADAMQHAHAKGVVHRDLKPRNIIVDERGVPLVMDFGLAKGLDRGTRLTRDGATLGTPAYMSPEQAGGDHARVDGRTDVYALGGILYELLSGHPPYVGDTAMEVLVQLMSSEARPLKEFVPTLHRDIETICMRAIERDLSRRYQSAGELRDDIQRYLGGDSILARPPGPLTICLRKVRKHRTSLAVGTLLLVGLVAFLVWRGIDRARTEAREAHVKAGAEVAQAESLLEQGKAAEAEAACGRALALDKGNPDALLFRARVLRAEGNLDAAEEDVQAVITSHPDSARAFEEVGQVALARGQADKALEAFQRALSLDPALDSARLLRGEAHLARREGEAARKDSEEALAKNLSDEMKARALVLKGRAVAMLGDSKAAHECFAAALAASPSCPEALVREGDLFLAERQYDRAAESFGKALRVDWTLSAASVGRAQALYRQLRFDDAVQDLNDAMARNPKDARILVQLARVYGSKGNIAQAQKFLDKAVALAPDDAATHVARGRQSLSAGRLDDAEKDLKRAGELAPSSADVADALGELLMARQDWNAARVQLARAVEIDASSAIAAGDLGWCEHKLEDVEHAQADLARCRQLAGATGSEPREYVDLGDSRLVDAKKKPLAKSYYEPSLAAYAFAVELCPRMAEAHVKAAEIHFLFGDFEEAKAEYGRAIEADPYFAAAYVGRAVLYRDNDRPPSPDKAMEDVQRVLCFAPDDIEALTLRAEILCQMEQWAPALADAERVLAKQPGYPRADLVRTMCLVRTGKASASAAGHPKAVGKGNQKKVLDEQFLGEHCLNQQRWEDAILAFTRAIEEDPTYAPAHFGRGTAYYQVMKAPEAMEEYGRAIELDPTYEMRYLSNFPKFKPLVILSWQSLGAQLDKKIPKDHPEAGVHLAYGFMLVEIEQWEKARLHMERAVELRPEFALSHIGLGILLLRQGKLEEAEKELRKGQELDAKLVSGHVFMAELHARRKEREQTMAELHTAVNLGMEEFAYVLQNPAFGFLVDDAEFRKLLKVR